MFVLSKCFLKFFKKLYSIYKILNYKLIYGNRVMFGKKSSFLRGFKLIIDREGYISIGNNTFFNYNCSISCLGRVEIGSYSIFGENVKIYDHNHKFNESNKIAIKDQDFKIGSVMIGSNCWIGSNVTILNNVKIGDNVVVGANCLIYKDIPSNTIVKNKTELIMSTITYKNTNEI
ncbi:acyltransferase [Heyndrickxia ginsengihumi]|uniref:acyltransferase n=1 Tax=Heyndrickxia ginsengihumi TaxID=363870 RepID=UPI003D1EA2D1